MIDLDGLLNPNNLKILLPYSEFYHTQGFVSLYEPRLRNMLPVIYMYMYLNLVTRVVNAKKYIS